MKSVMASQENRCLIDASALVGLIDRDDSHAEKAVAIFKDIKKNQTQAIVSDFVLQETFTILLYKRKGHLLTNILTFLQKDPLFELIDINIQTLQKTAAFAHTKSFQPKMSITDWSLAYLSTETKIPLVTFDKQLKNFCKKLA